jgi:hypothetical protein
MKTNPTFVVSYHMSDTDGCFALASIWLVAAIAELELDKHACTHASEACGAACFSAMSMPLFT